MKNQSNKKQQERQISPTETVQNSSSSAFSKKWLSSIPEIENLLSTQHKRVVLGIFCLAFLLRIIYFVQAKPTALLEWHNWDQSDMHFFDTWAKAINNGDAWGHQPLHPVYIWNDETANAYFKAHPEEVAKYQQNGDTSLATLSKNLWYHWYNDKNFHQEPLYAYLIAITYKIFGDSPHYVFFWQMLLGALSNVLIFLIGCHYFGRLTGFLAAILALLCGPLMCYDLVLLRSTLTVFLGLLVLYQLGKIVEEKSIKSTFLFGLYTGLAFLNQSYFILYFLFALIYLGYQNRRSITEPAFRGVRSMSMPIVGFGLVLIPLVVRNMVVGVSPFAMASNGGLTFLAANFAGVNPFIPFEINPTQYALVMYKTQGAFLPTFFETLTQYNVGSFFMLMWDKFRTIINWYEMPNNMNYYFFREWAPVLKLTFVTNFILSPLALFGFVWSIKVEKGKVLPLVVFLIMALIPLFYGTALSRYRVLMLSITTLFAAYTLVRMWYLFQEKNAKKLMLTAIAMAATFLFTTTSRPAPVYPYDVMDYSLAYGFKYRDPLKEDMKNKNWDGVVEKLGTFLEHAPPLVSELNAERKVQNENEYKIANYFLEMNTRYANFLIKIGKLELAAEPTEQANNLKNALEGVKY
jgi:4-amino-4-deoxy-L-arabinose transferase-like glycosyltransferase